MRIQEKIIWAGAAGLIATLLITSAVPAQPVTSQLRTRGTETEVSVQADPLGVTAVNGPPTISASIGQILIGWDEAAEQYGFGAGVWHFIQAPTLVAVTPGNAIGELALFQNYPNPFQHTTRIDFTVPTRDHISLRLFDVSGRAIAILIDKELAPGEYQVVVTANSLAPGLYFYRMQTSKEVFNRKLLLLESSGVNLR